MIDLSDRSTWPTETPTGSRVKRCTQWITRSDVNKFRYGPPMTPRQAYNKEIYDELTDSYRYEPVVLNDEEFERRMQAWRSDMVEWHLTGGIKAVRGPTIIEATFELEDGTIGQAQGNVNGTCWRWTEWHTRKPKQENLTSYEAWLRSYGLFEAANEANAGDPPGRGNGLQKMREGWHHYYAAEAEFERRKAKAGHQ